MHRVIRLPELWRDDAPGERRAACVENGKIVEIHIQKIRFKWIGKLGMCQFKWDYYTGRYKELNDNTPEPVIEEPKKITTNSTVDWNNPTNDIVF